MEINAKEISAVLKHKIEQFSLKTNFEETGEIIQVGDGIARIYGLDNVMANELIQFPDNVFGMALNLEEDNIGCILFGSETRLKEGDPVKRSGKIMQVPVGENLLGRVVDPLGQPLDGAGRIAASQFMPIERKAIGVVARQPVKEPLQTGIKAIDSLIPIGRGQRELIIGDRQIGKSTIAIDAILNQKGKDVFCIYVAIGQKGSTVVKVIKTLEEHGAMAYTTVMVSTANDPAPMTYIAPYCGVTMGDYFRDSGRHALIVYDDLTKHAQAYRQVSLLLRRPPGREAYPGDIFYLHSRLLERAAKLSEPLGGGSLTALPIIETQAGDFSAYIPTNVISITDGQIYLDPDLFYAGIRPAINVGLSVSRVGGNAQSKAMKQVTGKLRLDLAQYRELESFAKFSTDLDKTTQAQLIRGQRMVELLKQDQNKPVPFEKQILMIFLGTQGYLDKVPGSEVHRLKDEFMQFIELQFPDIPESIKTKKQIDDELRSQLTNACENFINVYLAAANMGESNRAPK